MKRFICVILCVVLCVSLLIIPISAAETSNAVSSTNGIKHRLTDSGFTFYGNVYSFSDYSVPDGYVPLFVWVDQLYGSTGSGSPTSLYYSYSVIFGPDYLSRILYQYFQDEWLNDCYGVQFPFDSLFVLHFYCDQYYLRFADSVSLSGILSDGYYYFSDFCVYLSENDATSISDHLFIAYNSSLYFIDQYNAIDDNGFYYRGLYYSTESISDGSYAPVVLLDSVDSLYVVFRDVDADNLDIYAYYSGYEFTNSISCDSLFPFGLHCSAGTLVYVYLKSDSGILSSPTPYDPPIQDSDGSYGVFPGVSFDSYATFRFRILASSVDIYYIEDDLPEGIIWDTTYPSDLGKKHIYFSSKLTVSEKEVVSPLTYISFDYQVYIDGFRVFFVPPSGQFTGPIVPLLVMKGSVNPFSSTNHVSDYIVVWGSPCSDLILLATLMESSTTVQSAELRFLIHSTQYDNRVDFYVTGYTFESSNCYAHPITFTTFVDSDVLTIIGEGLSLSASSLYTNLLCSYWSIKWTVYDSSSGAVTPATIFFWKNPSDFSIGKQNPSNPGYKLPSLDGVLNPDDPFGSTPEQFDSILSSYAGSLAFISSVIGMFLDIPPIQALLTVSFGLGLMLFVLNIVPTIASSIKFSSNKKH